MVFKSISLEAHDRHLSWEEETSMNQLRKYLEHGDKFATFDWWDLLFLPKQEGRAKRLLELVHVIKYSLIFRTEPPNSKYIFSPDQIFNQAKHKCVNTPNSSFQRREVKELIHFRHFTNLTLSPSLPAPRASSTQNITSYIILSSYRSRWRLSADLRSRYKNTRQETTFQNLHYLLQGP